MKKVVTGLVGLYLFVFFLIYCGVFRDDGDPVKVTKYYFQCMRNYEWILTYQVIEPGYFYPGELLHALRGRFSNRNIEDLKIELLDIEDDFAYVKAGLVYKLSLIHI